MSLKTWAAQKMYNFIVKDAPSSSSGKRDLEKGIVKRLGIRFGDIAAKDFEPPEFDLAQITTAYNTDSYIRQGIDKYVDQIFKEGYDIFGKNEQALEYLKLRLEFLAEGTGIPTGQLLMDIAEDVVKYGNSIVVKARMSDPAQLPPGLTVQGINGFEPVVGYFCVNPTTVQAKRDKNGTVTGWQQEVDGADKPVKFRKEDVVHVYYKKEKGNAFGTPFLIPVLDDVRALRQAEENVLRMMYRNIYPFYHIKVGDKDMPGTPPEVEEVQQAIDNMNVEGGLATTSRVEIKPIASDKVIDAEPYLRYLEERIFSGMGIPAIMFGRGNTANRSTGDNMASEMADRIKAIQKIIEMFINDFIFKELLMEGGYDPVLNPDDDIEFKFHNNDVDMKVKLDTHAIYQYEHHAITEDEMRAVLGRDPIADGDREKMFISLVDAPKAEIVAASKPQPQAGGNSGGNKETNNKQKPTNQHGTKTSPKKLTNKESNVYEGLLNDRVTLLRLGLPDLIDKYIQDETVSNKKLISRAISNTNSYVSDILEEMYDSTDIQQAKAYYGRLFNQLNDDIEFLFDTTDDLSEVKLMISSLLDVLEDRVQDTLDKELFARKEE